MKWDLLIIYRLGVSFFYYLLIFAIVYPFIIQFGFIKGFDSSNLLFFDAENYQKIAINGYSEKWLTAFFPLFPALWSLGLNVVTISVLNALIYIFSISWLSWKFKTNWYAHLVFLTFPSTIFFFLPYSESLFFLFTSMLLLGLKKNDLLLIFLSTLFAALTRPTIAVFIPAFWLMSLIIKNKQDPFNWRTPIIGSLGSLLGLCLVVVVQAAYLGEWFTFFEAQKLWGNELRMPDFPFSSWGGNNIVKLDAVAFWVGLSSGLLLIYQLFSKDSKIKMVPSVAFSLLYLSGTTLLILLYRGGDFFSLNRFIFATPFFLIVLHWLYKEVSWKRWYLLVILFVVVSFLFGSYLHIVSLLKWLLLTGFITIFSFIIYGKTSFSNVLRPLIMVLLIGIQAYFLWRFFTSQWIG